jgi:hypothetical protein
MDSGGSQRSLNYVIVAAAATVAAATLYVAAARVSRVGVFFGAYGDTPGGAGLWLKYALCFAAPAVLWAAALSRLVPRVALRVAGLVAQSWFVYFVIALSVVGVAYVAVAVLGDSPLTPAESASVFQSKIFCRGRLAAPAPATEADLAHAFFRSRDEVVRFGRWFSLEPPLHPALLCLGRLLGWPKLIPAVAAAVALLAVYFIGRRVLGFFGGAVAAVLAATSPAFVFTQASYLSGATFVCFFALAVWACSAVAEAPSHKAALALGVAAGAAFLVCEYDALYLAVPFGWYLWRRTRGRGVDWPRWFAAGVAPFVVAWALYNWRQTGNVFLPPRFFSDVAFFGFGGGYTLRDALSSGGRNLVVLSVDAFGWPLLCLVPAIWRLFWKPRPDDFEKALYGAIIFTILARLPLREAGAAYGATSYYASWLCLVFITARFFVILAAKAQRDFKKAGEGLAAFVLAALIAVNLAAYSPRAASHYGGRPRVAASSWTDPVLRRRVAASILDKAVVFIKPRDVCLSSMPGSPFLDDRVVLARDNAEQNAELAKMFPGRDFYTLDYRRFERSDEVTPLNVIVR